MQDRTHTRFHSAPAVIRAGAFLFLALCLLSLPRPAPADTVSLGAGPGCYRFSHDSESVLLRYEHDAAPLFNREGFWAGTFAAWSGENHAEAIGLSRGMRWPFGDSWHADAELGLNWISDTTENLGTPIQILLRGRGQTVRLPRCVPRRPALFERQVALRLERSEQRRELSRAGIGMAV